MAINNVNNLVNNASSKLATPAQGNTSGSSATAAAPSQETLSKATVRQDAVVLTDQAQSLNKLQQKVKDAPGFNQSKVESLKAAIERGEYKVDSERLAKKMVSLESELGPLYK